MCHTFTENFYFPVTIAQEADKVIYTMAAMVQDTTCHNMIIF